MQKLILYISLFFVPLVVINAQNVGIGTTTPQQKLHVKSSSTTSIRVEGDDTDYTNATIDLHVKGGGNARGAGIIMTDDVTNNSWFAGRPYSAGGGFSGTNDHFVINRQAASSTFNESSAIYDGAGNQTTTQNFLTIRNNGNVGIGTTNPLGLLHVYNPTPYTGNENDNASNSIVLYGSVSNAIGNHYGGITWASGGRKRAGISSVMEHSDGDYLGLAFWTQGTDGPGPMHESMRISHGGNVGIGTTSPRTTLDARGSMMLENRLLIGNTNQHHFLSNTITGMTDGIASSDAFIFVPLHATGTETSELRLYMADNTNESFSIWGGTCTGGGCNDLNNASQRFKVRADGLVTINSLGAGTVQSDVNGNLSVSSDERLKDITQNFDRGIESLINIQPIQYKWNEISKLETKHVYTGFSAQNVQKNIPEAVGVNADGYLTLDNRPIIATLVNAIQEQQLQLKKADIDHQKLTTELATLKQENETIKTRLLKIESMQAEIKNSLTTHAQK